MFSVRITFFFYEIHLKTIFLITFWIWNEFKIHFFFYIKIEMILFNKNHPVLSDTNAIQIWDAFEKCEVFFFLEIPQSSFFHIDKIKTSHCIIPSLDYSTLLNRTVHVNLTTWILIIFTPHIDPFQSIHKKSVSIELIT